MIIDKNNILNQQTFFEQIYQDICYLKTEYPDFEDWYFKTVYQGLFTGNRLINVITYNSEIAGISILKKTIKENKICTIRVAPKFQRYGLGTKLVQDAIKWLEDPKPIITVSEDRMNEFNSLFRNFNFNLHQECCGIYVTDKKELSFNGFSSK